MPKPKKTPSATERKATLKNPKATPLGFATTSVFHGYRAKEDITNLPPGYLVQPSRNVITNTAGLIQSRPGYALDGQAGTASTGILGSYDFIRGNYGDQHLRSGNSKLQYRYVAQAGDSWEGNVFTGGQVYWIDLLTLLTSNYCNFCSFFDFNSEKINVMLMVERASKITEWSGGVTTLASASKTAVSVVGGASMTSMSFAQSSRAFRTQWNNLAGTSGNGNIVFSGQPQDGDVLTFNINATLVNVQFVSTIGAVAGNVLIGATLADTITNLLGLLQNPATTSATQVAFSGPNQTLIAYLTYASANTITMTTDANHLTWASRGFYVLTSGRTVVINGNNYVYTSGELTDTIVVTTDPTGEAVQSVIHQLPVVTNNSSMTDLPATFRNDLIGNLGQQIYVGSLNSNVIYLSKIYNYKDYSQASPRIPGDGFTGTVDGLVNAIIPQETTMYVGWGDSGWTTFTFNLSADLVNEAVVITPLKVAPLQTALSQGLTCNIGNDLAFITNEPTFSTLGRVPNNLATPQITNFSDSIKNDMDDYTPAGFVDGQSIYTKYFIYVSVPQLGVVRKYNINQQWWDPPFNLPIARFSYINGALYGHSYLTDETYQLETGTNDNGNPIHSIAAFSYDNFEDRVAKKVFNEWYVEGYIAANTTLDALTKFDFGGFSGISTYQVLGNGNYPNSDAETIFQTIADGSLGKAPLGLNPIGSVTDSVLNLPKFRVIFTGIPVSFFEYQPYFESNDIDYQWAILAFGPRIETGPSPMEIRV